jgi:hypothetical protein
MGSNGKVQEVGRMEQLSTVRSSEKEIKPLWRLTCQAFYLLKFAATLQIKSKILSKRGLF